MKTQKGKKKLLLISASLLLAVTLAACNESTAGDVDVSPTNGTETNDPIVNTPDAGLDTDTDADVEAPSNNDEDAAAELEVGGVEGADDLGEADPSEGTESDLGSDSEASLDVLPEDSGADAGLEATLEIVDEAPATN